MTGEVNLNDQLTDSSIEILRWINDEHGVSRQWARARRPVDDAADQRYASSDAGCVKREKRKILRRELVVKERGKAFTT